MAAEETLHLETFAFGGEAMGRLDGRVTFVPYALPGETVRAEIVQEKGDYARAELIEVLERAPERTEPVCPYFGVCGGCQLQHATYEAQLRMKQGVVAEQLRRIGGFTEAGAPVRPTIGMVRPWEYRNHARFSVGRRFGELCFTHRGTHRLLRIDHCYLMHPSINATLHRLQGRLQGFTGHQLSIRAGANTGDLVIVPPIPSPLPAGGSQSSLPPASSARRLDGGSTGGDERGGRPLVDVSPSQDHLEEEILTRRFRVAAAAFFQVNTHRERRPAPQGLERWAHLAPAGGISIADILALLVFEGLDPRPGDVVADIYCGVGTFATLLAPWVAQVIGVEESAAAIQDATHNARDLSNVRFIQGKTEDVLPKLAERPSAVVLDPARVGCARPVLDALAALRPERLVYVSCDPATLARDLAILREDGFTLRSVQPVDMFPQTYHVESVAVLRR